MTILRQIRDTAAARGLIDPATVTLDADAAFRLVRDMPYQRASDRRPKTTVAEWRGTCSGKHYLLREVFEELGMPVVLIAATHEFTPATAPWLPTPLLEECGRSPVPDVHNFLRVQAAPHLDWQSVDATWPLAGRALGLPANEAFVPGEEHAIAADPHEVHHVPPDLDADELKQRMLDEVTSGQRDRREHFIEALSEWLTEHLSQGAAAGATAREGRA